VALTTAEVRRIAALAMLRLGDDEVETITRQLNTILEHVDALESAGAVDTEPLEDGLERTPLRPDEPGADPLATEPGTGAPGWDSGFFAVPRLASHDTGDGEPDAEAGAPIG
jgi:aspartyl-tRNA(Asn)/glutamyl-tRNA(Gln) amidotransferase subunit C